MLSLFYLSFYRIGHWYSRPTACGLPSVIFMGYLSCSTLVRAGAGRDNAALPELA
jgi:hypothetical protein